jgi:hypothetical protein
MKICHCTEWVYAVYRTRTPSQSFCPQIYISYICDQIFFCLAVFDKITVGYIYIYILKQNTRGGNM